MRSKSKSRQGKYSLLLLFVGIFAFWWGIAVLAQNNKPGSAAIHVPSASAAEKTMYTLQSIEGPVKIHATLKGDAYTYSGSVPLTSACDELGTGVSITGADTKHVTIVLTLQKPMDGCAYTTSEELEQPFAVSISVASGTKATLDGLTVNGAIVAVRTEVSAN